LITEEEKNTKDIEALGRKLNVVADQPIKDPESDKQTIQSLKAF
jgi:hypothetical protein